MTRDEVFAKLLDGVDLDEIARRVVNDHLITIPGYARLPEGLLAGLVTPIVRHNLDLFVACLREDRGPNDQELALLRESATQRGREGIPLQDMLHGYRLGARVAWRTLIDSAPDGGEHAVLLDIADRVMDYIDEVSTAVTQAYLDERDQLVSEQERLARALLDGLAEPATPADVLLRLMEMAGVRLGEQVRPFALTLVDGTARDHARIALALRSRGILALTEGDRVCGVTTDATTALPLDTTGAALSLGPPIARDGLAEALELARLKVELARRAGRAGVLQDSDLLAELLLAGSPERAEAIRVRVLTPLEEYAERRSSDLLETLSAFIECGQDRRMTAKRLSVHANTLDYRLQRIEQLTGLRLHDPDDLTLVVLALKQRGLCEAPQVPAASSGRGPKDP